MKKYDYIILGAGCASLTFLYKLFSLKKFQSLKILVLDDKSSKPSNKTWCFWDNSNKHFQDIIRHNWKKLEFKVREKLELVIEPYSYNTITGEDFEKYTLKFLLKFENIKFLETKVIGLKSEEDKAIIKTETQNFEANYIFNSTLIDIDTKLLDTKNSLHQHFKGVEIETEDDCFDSSKATFMDFSVSQSLGTAFVYILPTTSKKALIEYTFFNKIVLKEKKYDNLLEDYINENLKIKKYKIVHSEMGVIPMCDYKFDLFNGRIINLGTRAGCVKPSTGYAFKRIQEHCDKLIELLQNDKAPYLKRSFNDKKFHYYDSILLEVIAQNKMQGSDVFEMIFRKNKASLVLKFLDNKTNIFQDIKIMSSVPMKIFLPIALKKLFK